MINVLPCSSQDLLESHRGPVGAPQPHFVSPCSKGCSCGDQDINHLLVRPDQSRLNKCTPSLVWMESCWRLSGNLGGWWKVGSEKHLTYMTLPLRSDFEPWILGIVQYWISTINSFVFSILYFKKSLADRQEVRKSGFKEDKPSCSHSAASQLSPLLSGGGGNTCRSTQWCCWNYRTPCWWAAHRRG